MAVPDEASHPGVAGASLSSEVQQCCKRRSHVPPPPSALMPFAQEKRRSVATMNANENNRRVSCRLAKLRRPLHAADKEPLQRKVAEAVAVHRRKYPDYAHHPREARRRKEQERIAKQVTSKLKNASSWDKEQQPRTCTVTAQGRSSPKFQQQQHPPPLPPTPSSKHRGTIRAAPVRASDAGVLSDRSTTACSDLALKVTSLQGRRDERQPECPSGVGRLTKLWRPLRAADKEPFQRKVAEAVAGHQRKYPNYAHHPREARRRKEQERIAKQVTRKLKNGSSWDKEQQPTTCMVAAHARAGPVFQQQLHPPPLPPTRRSKHRGTISAAPVGASGTGQKTVASLTTATVLATTKDLEGQVVPVKVAALRALAELLKRQPQHFHSYAELTLIKIFGTFKQPEREVSCAADLCSMEASAALPPEQTMRLLHSLIGEPDDHLCNEGDVPARGSASKKG
ncbi:hypothetical protein HPB49_010312 [Dermacentor silvarum]|uniref:Uncharacterized protein n=1 Tax=Dermacentor silvarum TaxID=543639 RepID=A0ACB8DYP8_DERSI|nr:hypothetical protein HPB49_010312 [Dermacentor silvarum]